MNSPLLNDSELFGVLPCRPYIDCDGRHNDFRILVTVAERKHDCERVRALG